MEPLNSKFEIQDQILGTVCQDIILMPPLQGCRNAGDGDALSRTMGKGTNRTRGEMGNKNAEETIP